MIASNTGGLAALDQRQGVMKITTAQFYMMLAARADVYRNHKLSAGAKVFFVLITDCCHDEEEGGNAQGVWRVSFPQLTKRLGVSSGSVARWIRQLETAGYITVDRPGQNPHGKPNGYSIRNIQN